jgi:hypothetical protein
MTMAAQGQKVQSSAWPIPFNPHDMVKLEGKDVPTSRFRALVPRLAQVLATAATSL